MFGSCHLPSEDGWAHLRGLDEEGRERQDGWTGVNALRGTCGTEKYPLLHNLRMCLL